MLIGLLGLPFVCLFDLEVGRLVGRLVELEGREGFACYFYAVALYVFTERLLVFGLLRRLFRVVKHKLYESMLLFWDVIDSDL